MKPDGVVAIESIERSVQPRLERAKDASFRFEGILRGYLGAISEHWLQVVPDANPFLLRMFAERNRQPPPVIPEFVGEFAGKYLAGAAQILALTDDGALRTHLRRFVERLISHQGDDGYLGPFPEAYQLTGKAPHLPYSGPTWDGWGHYHVMNGLLIYGRHMGDDSALQAAAKIGDLFVERFLGKQEQSNRIDMGNSTVNYSPMHTLAVLYGKTKNPRHLALAEQIIRFEVLRPNTARGLPSNDYLRDAKEGKKYHEFALPRWESLHIIQGFSELYWATGNEEYRSAFEHIWWSIAEHDRHNTGGFGSAEQAQGSPYHRGAIETCATSAWTAVCVDMLRLTGNPVVADELELTVLNAVMGSHSRDGRWSTYNTPMDGRRIANTTELAWQDDHVKTGATQLNCCSMHAPRGFGTINDWALMTDGKALVLNWYGPGTMRAAVGGTEVVLTQQTDYPRTGRIHVTVSPAKSMRFPLKLRVPHWSEQTRLKVNGKVIEAVAPGTYAVINREWQPQDTVEIELDMSLQYWLGEEHYRGKASIFRGPILLAWDTKRNAAPSEELLPAFDATRMEQRLLDADEEPNAMVAMELADIHGAKVRLLDFDSAGEKGTYYVSWLPVRNGAATPFSRENPRRSGGAAESR